MSRIVRALAFGSLVFGLAACGGSGTAPTGPAVKAPQCPVTRLSSKLTVGTCRSPDGAWRLRFRQGTEYGRLFLARRSQGKGVQMYHSNNDCCTDIAWARPDLLLFLDYPLVESLDPATRIVTVLGDLNDFVVSPNGRWVAGSGASGPGDPVATTVYVLGVGAKKCLVVPGSSADAAGFTRDSKAVIVNRNVHPLETQLRQFALSSLHGNCPRQQVKTERVTSIGS
jgi:hypothetical protein